MLPFDMTSKNQHFVYKHELYKILGDIETHPEMFGSLKEVFSQYELLLMLIYSPGDVRRAREKAMNEHGFYPSSTIPLPKHIKNKFKKKPDGSHSKKRMKYLIKVLIQIRTMLEMTYDQGTNSNA